MTIFGIVGVNESKKKIFDAFDNFKMPNKQLIAEGNFVVVYMEFIGTHANLYLGIESSGDKVHFAHMMFLRTKDGKII